MATTSVTELIISNLALTELGASPLTNLYPVATTDNAFVCNLHYARLKNSIISKYNWTFTKKQNHPNRLTVAPDHQYLFQFQMPSDRAKGQPIAVFLSSEPQAPAFNNYEIHGDKLLTDVEDIFIDYISETEADTWPEFFIEFVAVALAAKICIAVTGDEALKKEKEFEAWGSNRGIPGGLYASARQADFKDQPPPAVEDFELINARHGGVEF